jgi:Ca2+-binding EF-hand superfamily protein
VKRRAALVFATLVFPGILKAAEEKTLSRPDAAFLVRGEEGTVRRISLHVTIDGRRLDSLWAEAFDQLFDWHDRNGDGKLLPEEAQSLPSPFALRQNLWNPISQFTGRISSGKVLDEDDDGIITREEMGNYYQRNGLDGITIGVGQVPGTKALTESLLGHLDFDKDQSLTGEKGNIASVRLEKLDANADELIAPDELVPRLTYPGTAATQLWPAAEEPSPLKEMPLRRLRLRAPEVQPQETARTEKPSADVNGPKIPSEHFQITFSEPGIHWHSTADGVKLSIREDEGKLQAQITESFDRLRRRFQEANTNGDEALDSSEMVKKDQSDLRELRVAADRNADGLLTKNEVEAWMSMQKALAKGHVLISILDYGSGLFELLDVDEDGRLSIRERRNALALISKANDQAGPPFDSEKLPRQLRVIVSRGQPKSVRRPLADNAPSWFTALDRNRDGDLSPREFIGSQTDFERIDRNHDGLISSAEAAAETNPKK